MLKDRPRITVWSAACSTGEEPYSLVFNLVDTLGVQALRLQLIATDISIRVLENAKGGMYPAARFQQFSPQQLRQYLLCGKGQWKDWYLVKQKLREVITFQRLRDRGAARYPDETPATTPGIVITQHIPLVFSKAFAVRLNELCAMQVKEAEDGDVLHLAGADCADMLVRKAPEGYRVQIKDGPQVCYQRPSAGCDVQLRRRSSGKACRRVILTGMGSDGAQGMLK